MHKEIFNMDIPMYLTELGAALTGWPVGLRISPISTFASVNVCEQAFVDYMLPGAITQADVVYLTPEHWHVIMPLNCQLQVISPYLLVGPAQLRSYGIEACGDGQYQLTVFNQSLYDSLNPVGGGQRTVGAASIILPILENLKSRGFTISETCTFTRMSNTN